MTSKKSFGAWARYQFDKSMSAGPIALIGWLALISLAVIVIAGLVLTITRFAQEGAQPLSFGEAMWESLMRTLDSGTMGGDTGWGFRAVMLGVTLGGIFIVSTLIGILSSGIEGKLEDLRKGRSFVMEKDHTIIFNWSASVFDIVSELVVANESRRSPRIVIMAGKDKVEMEDEIADKAGSLKNTKVICRSGDPNDLHDIRIVNPQESRSIIILSPDGDDPDSQVIKTIVALVNDPERRQKPYRIAAEIRDARNIAIARQVGGKEVQLVLADDLLARIVVHSSRQSGLSSVYTELLDFDGSEVYVQKQPELAGQYFGEAVLAYESSVLIGLASADGAVELNPSMDRVIGPDDSLILVAEDDSAIKLNKGTVRINSQALREGEPEPDIPEHALILGWNRRGPLIVRELSRYVAPGSRLTVVADWPHLAQTIEPLKAGGDRIVIDTLEADSTDHDVLEHLGVANYDHVLVLGYSDTMATQPADTKTLVTLLHLRRLADQSGRHINIVSEMIDVRNRELAEVTRADDFVVSNKLVSLMLAQASENEHISAIFGSLLDEEGSEIYIRPAAYYVALGTPVDFFTVTASAALREQVAIGYCLFNEQTGRDKVVVNPKKSEPVNFGPRDRIVVLARS